MYFGLDSTSRVSSNCKFCFISPGFPEDICNIKTDQLEVQFEEHPFVARSSRTSKHWHRIYTTPSPTGEVVCTETETI
jgi:hypothetical protein